MASSESFPFAVSVALSRQCNRRSERGWIDATADGTVWSLCVVLMILVCRSITIFLRLRALKEMEVRSVDNINIMLIIFLLYLLKKSKETVKTKQSSMPQTSVNHMASPSASSLSTTYFFQLLLMLLLYHNSHPYLQRHSPQRLHYSSIITYTTSAFTTPTSWSSPSPMTSIPLPPPDGYHHRTTKVFPITTTTATKTYATTALIKHTTTTTITRFHIPQKLTKG